MLRKPLLALVCCFSIDSFGSPEPMLTRVPEGGLQPQTVVDQQGTTHLVYFGGDPKTGDLFYVKRAAGEASFTKPIRVNSNRGDAIAVGTIRGAQIALGKSNRLHI